MVSDQRYCKTCGKPIDSIAFSSKYVDYGNDSAVESIEFNFCSELCQVIDNLLDPFHNFMGDLNTVVNHLIHDHLTDPALIEKALNSDLYKKLRDP